jgi:hypothetical protein
MKYLSADSLIEKMKSLSPHMTYTHDRYEIESHCSVLDLEWNQMDQEHRPWIHKTYLKSLRVWSSENSQLSISQLKLLGIPLTVAVTDVRVQPGLYYQSFSLFNLFYVHAITHCTSEKQIGEWYIFSHKWLLPIQRALSRHMMKMNNRQNPEDVPVRKRRTELRKLGYSFDYDADPNFLSCNKMTNNTIYPKMTSPLKIDVSQIQPQVRTHVKQSGIELVLEKNLDGTLKVWHGVCPHEGAPMIEGKLCGDHLECQWHGLKFLPQILKVDASPVALHNYRLSLDSRQNLHIEP